jgi:hypothetical protein
MLLDASEENTVKREYTARGRRHVSLFVMDPTPAVNSKSGSQLNVKFKKKQTATLSGGVRGV